MAGSTDHFNLAFFDFGDELDSPVNIRKEIDRFVLIDRQLYGMFNIFGNGVITGWDVGFGSGNQVVISPGVGIIDSLAVETEFSDSVDDLPANSTVYIYAKIDENTVLDRYANFFFSRTQLQESSSILYLASVVVGGLNVLSIDNSVRQVIGFKQIVKEEIAKHRHNGSDAPKIDLSQEVQGELTMDRIEDIDASKIKGGKLPRSVLPTFDHTKLQNIGTLSHAQLDSFAQSITRDNIALFGEVATINLMKMLVYMKYLDTDADRYWINTLLCIPGVTSDEVIDWDNTNANVDKDSNCISGLPVFPEEISVVGSGSSSSSVNENLAISTVSWIEDQEFRDAITLNNLTINNGVRLSVDTVDARIIESFDTGIAGQNIGTYQSVLEQENETLATFDQPAAEGALAGKFSTENVRRMKHVRTFPRSQDWSIYDTLNIYVKSTTVSRAPVTLILRNTDGDELASYLLLDASEQTTLQGDNAATNGFALKSFPIIGFERNDVASIEFTTDVITNEVEFFHIDTIFLTSQDYLLPQGTIRFRYNTTSAVIFNGVEYYGDFPNGTDFRLRVRVANTLEELSQATFTSLLDSGEVFSLPGSYIEIDITFLSDATRTKTPDLSQLYLSFLAPSEQSGLTIQSVEAWRKGVSENILINDQGVISMDRTNVGNFYFINDLSVNELDLDELPVSGVTADNMPIAPYQGYAAIEPDAQVPDEYNPGREFLRGLYQPKSVQRQGNGNFLIADTGNDRVIEMTHDGQFVRGFGSHNYSYDNTLYALTACYNPRMNVLFITFSRDLDIRFIDLTRIILRVRGRDIQLSNAVDKVRELTGELVDRPNLEEFLDGSSGTYSGLIDNTLSVILSPEKQAIITNASTDTVSVRIIGNPSPATNAAVPLDQPAALEVFVGDYMYFGRGGIWRPICAIESEADRYLICNARLNGDRSELADEGIASILEVEKATGSNFEGELIGTTFTYSKITFSDIMLGSVFYYRPAGDEGFEERKLLVAGLIPQGAQNPTSSSSSTQNLTVGTSEVQQLSGFVGKVQIIDMDSELISFNYTSPDGLYPSDAYINDDGNVVIAESSVYPQSGRIVTVDALGTVINLVGAGMYSKIWDIRRLPDDHIFVST